MTDMKIERFEDLKSWQEVRKLTQITYRLTKKQAFSEDRALVWQIRDAAVSTMSNIAEAHGRYSFEDKRRLLDISLGSCKEIQNHLYVAIDQAYIDPAEIHEGFTQADVVGKLINAAINNLDSQISQRSSNKPGPRFKGR
jgi:four helix bundle protein